jgi:hypothetical protein
MHSCAGKKVVKFMLDDHLQIRLLIILVLLLLASGCESTPEPVVLLDREQVLDEGAVKWTESDDPNPPQLFSNEFEAPVAIQGGVNTVGAEDSPFITPDGKTLYFFFTPDVNVPYVGQVQDGVSGIYESHLVGSGWSRAERVLLQDPGRLAMDGCPFIMDGHMWFCTVREGYDGIHWFTADNADGDWANWQVADFDSSYQVGELHISPDGSRLYFHSDRPGGMGGLDIWVSSWADSAWAEPVNVTVVNTADNEGWPALNPQGDELWFTRNDTIWRSQWVDGSWAEPEMILAPLAGEPSIDSQGNVYFVHHFFIDGQMIEADVYLIRPKGME